MNLDTSSLEKALISLMKILARPYDEFIRDGSIQRFEYTFELSWKVNHPTTKVGGLRSNFREYTVTSSLFK